jgi:hypothetical protein
MTLRATEPSGTISLMFATFFHELNVIPAQAGTQCR